MAMQNWLLLGVFGLGAISLVGFFKTKKSGFGKYTTSALLLILVLTISSALYIGGGLQADVMANVFFALVGFAGGLFTGKDASA